MTITIQEHGIYERRDGVIKGPPLRIRSHDDDFEWSMDGAGYKENGSVYLSRWEHPKDIIREIVVGPGWLPHNGGENPAPGKWVDVVFRDGGKSHGITSDARWNHTVSAGDILAYRIIEEANTAKEGDVAFVDQMVRNVGDQLRALDSQKKAAKLRDDMPPLWTVELTDNGGYIVTSQPTIPGARPIIRAAVSNDADLIAWLTWSEKE